MLPTATHPSEQAGFVNGEETFTFVEAHASHNALWEFLAVAGLCEGAGVAHTHT